VVPETDLTQQHPLDPVTRPIRERQIDERHAMTIEHACIAACGERIEERGERSIARQLLRTEHTGGADRSMQEKVVVGEVLLWWVRWSCGSLWRVLVLCFSPASVSLWRLCFSMAPLFLSRACVSLGHLIHMASLDFSARKQVAKPREIPTSIPSEAPPQP
jgi:hypothetical protein